MGTIPASENIFPLVELAEGAAASTPPSGNVRLYAKSDGLLYWKDDAGTEYGVGVGDVAAHLADTADAHDASAVSFSPTGTVAATDVQAAIAEVAAEASGSGQGLKDFASLRYAAGDITCDADQVWEDLAGPGDLTLTAVSGDWIEVGVSFTASNTTGLSICFDVATIVSAAVVNHVSTGAAPDNAALGISGWRIPGSVVGVACGSILYQLQSGDITSGTVVLRLRDRPQSNTNRNINAGTDLPLHFWAKNLGASI